MNKLLVTTTLIGSLIAAPALAGTQGTSIGLSLISTQGKSYDTNNIQYSDDNISYGLDVKHAISFGDIYVAPGVFYDHNAVNGYQAVSGVTTDTNLRYSYGVKADIGYDVNDKISVFGTVGHAELRVASATNAIKADSTEEAFIYGGGVKYNLSDRIDTSISYEESDLNKSNDVFNATDPFNARFRVIRLRLGYKF